MNNEPFGFVDDPEIGDDSVVWRRIRLKPKPFAILDKRNGITRPTSQAFQFSSENDGISVLLKDIVDSSGRSEMDLICDEFTLASLISLEVRDEELGIMKTLGDDEAHADIFDKINRSRSQKRKISESLARKARWVGDPPELP